MTPVLDIRNLTIGFRRDGHDDKVVHGIDLTIDKGETVALVGESGSGKSVTARSIIGLAGPNAIVSADRFDIDGTDVRGFDERQWQRLRGEKIGFVLQDALVSLDPLRRISQQLSDAFGGRSLFRRPNRHEDSRLLLQSVGIPDPDRRLQQYPHQLSGGLRQRTLIATAVARRPSLLIADEPTTALDATVQKQILDLLLERRKGGHTLLLISHDLAVVEYLCEDIVVMFAGRIVERGSARAVLTAPAHPYTAALLASMPSMDPDRRTAEAPISGDPPNPIDLPSGCRFHPRCKFAAEICRTREPALDELGPTHRVACHMALPGSGHPASVGAAA